MKTREKMKVMQSFDEGDKIESKIAGFSVKDSPWGHCPNPKWNWGSVDYRLMREPEPKPEPTLLERIEKNWPDKIVKLLKWGELDEDQERLFLIMDDICGVRSAHVLAQSMKGFAGYVYEDEVQGKAIFGLSGHPVNCDRMGGFKGHPIAVLFSK